MAVSNAIGSNVFDILVCLGLPWFLDTAIVNPNEYVKVTSKGKINFHAIKMTKNHYIRSFHVIFYSWFFFLNAIKRRSEVWWIFCDRAQNVLSYYCVNDIKRSQKMIKVGLGFRFSYVKSTMQEKQSISNQNQTFEVKKKKHFGISKELLDLLLNDREI